MTSSKEKIAISIGKGLLKRVDARVDGTSVKSRSHAIELLLLRALGGGQALRALVLCGGEGKGLRPLTYKIPKPMLEVGDKPMLQRIIEWLKAHDVKRITLAVGYLGQDIEEYFGNGEKFGVEIDYAREKEPLGTAGPLNFVRDSFNGTFLVLNGDVLCDLDLRAMIEAHRKSNALVTMALKSVREPGNYGVAGLEGERITRFEEKAVAKAGQSGKHEPRLVNAGVYVMSERIFDHIPSKGMLERDVFPKLARKGLMRGYVFTGKWVDVSDNESLKQAEREMA